MENSTEKFARKDSVTGKGINEGFCFGDGDFYCLNQTDAERHAEKIGFKDLEEAYEEEAYYWTEWEVEEGESWYDAEGNEFKKCHKCKEETAVNEEFYFCTHCLTHL